jgi:hypothetical protein
VSKDGNGVGAPKLLTKREPAYTKDARFPSRWLPVLRPGDLLVGLAPLGHLVLVGSRPLHLVRFRSRAKHIRLGFASHRETTGQSQSQRNRTQFHLVFDYPALLPRATSISLENCNPITPVYAGKPRPY